MEEYLWYRKEYKRDMPDERDEDDPEANDDIEPEHARLQNDPEHVRIRFSMQIHNNYSIFFN